MDFGLLTIEGSDYKIEKTSEFYNSYFRKEYLQAYKTVNVIVNNTLKRKKEAFAGNTQWQNIIPFVGKRGSGKTSAMLSFAKSLEKYNSKLPETDAEHFMRRMDMRNQSMNKFERENGTPYYVFRDDSGMPLSLEFICLDCIDGFLLEQEEDIFRVILGQMYAKIESMKNGMIKERGNYEYSHRQLLLQFDKVYRTVCMLGRPGYDQSLYEESAITSLKNLTSSLTIKKEFSLLVQRYLELLAYHSDDKGTLNGKASERFLVITIDDLDMNIHNGYEMLGKINRYMMVNNVIVLFATDYDQLKILCEREFYHMVPNFDRKLREKDGDVDRLARDYLEKVIPADDRIYIPDLRKVSDVRVKIDSNAEMGLKQLVFAVIRQKLGMRMDTGGGKRHFYEQNSMRAFVNFYLMLKRMNDLQTDGIYEEWSRLENDYLSVYETNYRILMSDTVTRMVDERLNTHYKEVFQRITEMSHPNSFRNLYFEILKNSGDAEDDSNGQMESNRRNKAYLPDLVRNLEYYGYSYGEVLRIIYCWGRENMYCKETIRCLMAFYSLELNRSYQYYCKSNDEKERQAERTRFIETMNGSISGSWANKMFPKVWYKGTEHRVGYRKEVDMSRVFQFVFTMEHMQMTGGKLKPEGTKKDNKLLPVLFGGEDVFLKECRQMFRTILVFGMFFEQPHYKTDSIFRWNIQKAKSSENESIVVDDISASFGEVSIHNADGKSYFGIFNFVSNMFCYRENLRPLMISFYKCLFQAGDNFDESEMESFFAELGIDDEIGEWEEKSHGFALPVYDFDLMYNLMKRLRQRGYLSESIETDEVLDYIRSAFEFIRKKLEENDQFYREAGRALDYENASRMEESETELSEIFISCPFVKWIFDSEKEDGTQYLLPQFDSMFTGMIKHLLEGNTSSELQEKDVKDIHGYDD